jgi:hypothetical protein
LGQGSSDFGSEFGYYPYQQMVSGNKFAQSDAMIDIFALVFDRG